MARILFLAFFQNVAFSIVSRSRNRNNLTYHLIAATLSNTIWFLTFRALVTANMDFILFVPYTVGTVAGSLYGVKVSMKIETWLGAASDSHIKTVPQLAMSAVYVTKEDLDNALSPIKAKITILEGRIRQVYSRSLRKIRSTFDSLRPVRRLSKQFYEKIAVVERFSPSIPKYRATRRWTAFDRAGQMRLSLEG
jgi:hypothetical protein